MRKKVIKIVKSIGFIGLYYIFQIMFYCIFTLLLSLGLVVGEGFLQAIEKANVLMNRNHNLVFILTSISALFLLFLLLKKKREKFFKCIKDQKITLKKALWTVCLGSTASIVINIILNFLVQSDGAENEIRKSKGEFILYIIGVVVIAVVVEEILFREIVFRDFQMVMSLPSALIISSLFFGISHGNLIQFIYTFFMGILFAYLLFKENNVLYSIISHMSFNCAACILAYVNQLSIQLVIVIVLISLVLFVVSFKRIFLDYKRIKKKGVSNELLY